MVSLLKFEDSHSLCVHVCVVRVNMLPMSCTHLLGNSIYLIQLFLMAL